MRTAYLAAVWCSFLALAAVLFQAARSGFPVTLSVGFGALALFAALCLVEMSPGAARSVLGWAAAIVVAPVLVMGLLYFARSAGVVGMLLLIFLAVLLVAAKGK